MGFDPFVYFGASVSFEIGKNGFGRTADNKEGLVVMVDQDAVAFAVWVKGDFVENVRWLFTAAKSFENSGVKRVFLFGLVTDG